MRGSRLALAALAAIALALPAGAAPKRAAVRPAAAQALVTIRADRPGPVINRYVYGQFSEMLGSGIYGGIYVGADSPIPNTHGFRNDVIAALKELHVPLVRWPGGCFADYYHWRDGSGPQSQRPVRINGWGDVLENNAFGTREFFEFLDLIGADAYVNADVGTGSPQEAADWLEYMTGDQDTTLVRLRRADGRDQPWKVAVYAMGNETWGCGGNMTPQYYADLYNRFATFLRTPQKPGPVLLAAGDRDGSETDFTSVLMANRRAPLDAISMHYYTTLGPTWFDKDTATGFSEDGWIRVLANTLRMDGYIRKHDAVMAAAEKKEAALTHRPAHKVALYIDEWGDWFQPTPGSNPGFLVQQNTLRDALVAAANFNIFHKYAGRVQMTAIAQTVNVLQAVLLTDGPKMLKTPTYWAYDLYKPFQDAVSLPVAVKTGTYRYGRWSIPQVSASAALAKDGALVIGLVNFDPHHAASVSAAVAGLRPGRATGEVLTAGAMDAHNTFADPDAVHPAAFMGARLSGNTLIAKLPPMSVVVLRVR